MLWSGEIRLLNSNAQFHMLPFLVLMQACGYGGEPSDCTPCEAGHFSSLTNNAHRCDICVDCGGLNRAVVQHCEPKRNAICGACLHGYTDARYEGALNRMELACYPSPNQIEQNIGTTLPWENTNTTSDPVQSPHASHQSLLVFALPFPIAILLFAILITCLICKRFRRKPKNTNRTNSVQSVVDIPIEEWGPCSQQESGLNPLQEPMLTTEV